MHFCRWWPQVGDTAHEFTDELAPVQPEGTGNPPYSISPYSPRRGYSGKGGTTLQDAPPLRSAGRISSGAARGYHLVAVTPLDLGAMLTADRP